MTNVFLLDRELPDQDFEGDDFTPGAGGKWVTCTDTALGRMIAYATNGRINKDGRIYRASIPGNPGGITLLQAQTAAQRVAGVSLVRPMWHWADVLKWLTACNGLVVQGWYGDIPRAYRYQKDPSAFGHAMFISHFSPSSGMRVWDPLDANATHHGQWIPAQYIKTYMEHLQSDQGSPVLFCGYVALQHL
jgi:hypothetical protein